MEGPLLGQQMPRLYSVPERHEQPEDGCYMCDLEGEEGHAWGCGDGVAEEALDWAEQFGYELDPWQKWYLRHLFGRKPDGRWSSRNAVLIVSRQNGKGDCALTEPLYTTSRGWVTYADVKVGDFVLGSDGKPTRVLYTSPVFTGRDCYEVAFTDGSRVVASQYHLWHVREKGGGPWRDISTEELACNVGKRRPDSGRMEYNWRVRCDTVPETPESELSVDPYLLGYWLGDGTHTAAQVTVGAEDLPWTQKRLYQAGAKRAGWNALDEPPVSEPKSSTAFTLKFRLDARMRDGFESRLRQLGVWGSKHIPEAYLTASVAQRRALLAGLMDSDGSITRNNATPQCEFTTSCLALADGFHRLARSLGIKVSRRTGVTRLGSERKKDRARFLFTAPFCPFEMPRKADRWRPPASNRHELMSITSVTPVPSVPTRCIKIAAEDGIYLTGRLFTPTHNTILEVRELVGLFLLQEELIIHTSHQLKTSLNHLERLQHVLMEYPALRKRVSNIRTGNGKEAIILKPRPTLIFGASGKEILRPRSSKLEFHARSGAATSRGFSCDCLVYDEAMILSDEQVGASYPTMSAMPNPQIIYAASAGLEDETVSVQLAKMRRNMKRKRPGILGAEWSVNPHDDSCPRDEDRGRESNYYIICDKHDDRDDPRSWAKSNPAMGYRISPGFTQDELDNMPARKFDIERLAIGNWPSDEEPWMVISKPAWKILTNEEPGFWVPPMVVGFDVAEDGSSATVMCSWEHKQHQTVVEMPADGCRQGTVWLIPWLKEKVRKWKPLAIAVPKSGPAAGLLDDAVRQWGDRVYPVGPGEEAAAFAFFIQQVNDKKLWHFGEAKAPTLWKAVGKADTRVVGDGGKAWCRRDSEADITPVTAATLAAYVLNKKRRSYDLSNTIA